ncbi:MAG: S8 family serine peptidase [Caldilineaceae bacterium]
MKIWTTLVAIFLVVSGSFINSGHAAAQDNSRADAWIAPQVQQSIQAAASDTMISVIVELKDQEDLRPIEDHERRKRLRKVVDRLKRKSRLTQRPVQSLLRKRANQGQVASFTSYWIFNGLEVTATAAVIQELAKRPEVASVIPNATVQAPDYPVSSNPPEANLALVNAPALWNMGWQGQGIVVANLDTGVDATHPDLVANWRGGTNSWFDPYGEHPDTPIDLAGPSSGHGTWTMGIMVGGDSGGTSIGMAPAAQWIAAKIFNDQGAGTAAGIHAAYQWLLDPDGDPATDDAPNVVNNSWTFQTPGCNLEFAADLQALRTAGILPIFAAGNSGPNAGSSLSPANNPGAFAVGGVDNSDALYVYSSRGPTTCSGEPIFPHLVAPGVNVRSADRFSLYTNATGTSLAAPHVSGALALLLSAFPELSAVEQETSLINGAIDLGTPGADNNFGYGRLDVLNSYQWLNPLPVNQPPTANAGADGTITLPADAQLSGTATDDGLPAPANLVATWSVVSGPGTVSFGDAQALQTKRNVQRSRAHLYLRLTADDGALTATDDLALTVNPAPPLINRQRPT